MSGESGGGNPPAPAAVVLTGPTAGGKTGLACNLARLVHLPILSLDSMKIYRGMDIGTAKPPPALRRQVSFHLIDIRDPWEAFSVGDYLEELQRLTPSTGLPWLFCGGTAFYLNALIRGIFAGPPANREIRRRLAEEAEALGVDALHDRLQQVDPLAASAIHRGDLRRIVRALEVHEMTGEPISRLQKQRRALLGARRTLLVGVARERAEIHRRIDERVERMFDAGWVEEVKALLAAHDPPWGKQASQSIGYTLIREALERREDPSSRIPEIQARTRRFARAQLTWLRKMPIEWWRPVEQNELLDRLASWVETTRRGGEPKGPDPDRLGRRGPMREKG